MKNVQDIYPLSPMQQAMLLHAVARPSDNALVNQFVYELRGLLAADKFRSAWQAVIDRHPALRTAFVWGGKSGPLQVVQKAADIAFAEHDWSTYSTQERAGRWAELLAADQSAGFDLRRPPLMRISIVRYSDHEARMLWTSHHLVVDRWCVATLWSDALAAYQSLTEGKQPDLPRAAPYRSYIGWLQHQSAANAEAFWRDYLAGFQSPLALSKKLPGGAAAKQLSAQQTIGQEELDSLAKYAQRCGVTLNVALQLCLALAIQRVTGEQDVLFGITVSGRPSELSGVGEIVGTFVGNVPMRVQFEPQAEIATTLRDLQTMQHRRSSFDYLSLAELHACADLPAGKNLFDTILVSLAPLAMSETGPLQVLAHPGSLKTAMPITIGFENHGEGLEVRVTVAAGFEPVVDLDGMLNAFADSLKSLHVAGEHAIFADLPGFRGTAARKSERDTRVLAQFDASTMDKTVEGRGDSREAITVELLLELLQGVWHEVLEQSPASDQANFFEAGGDSLRAVRFHQRVEQLLRVRVPLLALFQEPTPARMAAVLLERDWPAVAATVVPVRRGGNALPPLFLIASPEVNTVGYAMLARHLDAGRAAWVVQEQPDPGGIRRLQPSALPAMAGRYVAEIRRVQSSGPYLLLGMCTGAHLAREMALQLQAAGETVEFVGVVNTWAHYTVAPIYHLTRRINKLRYYWGRVQELSRQPTSEWARVFRKLVGRESPHRAEEPVATESGDAATAVAPPSPDADLGAARDPWIDDFGWRHKDRGGIEYPGTITVLRIRPQQYWRTRERDLGWGRHAAHTVVIDLPGTDHHSILREPFVRDIAQRLRDCWRGTSTRNNKKEKSNNDCESNKPLELTD